MEKEALLWKRLPGSKVLCELCSHFCMLENGKTGHCGVRLNLNGTLFSLNYGLTSGLAIDPVEKKPFFHFKPGSLVMSFGSPGCNFRCLNCQNWDLSQARNDLGSFRAIPPSAIVDSAIANSCDGYAYTYSEPTIFFEYVRDTVLEARKRHKSAYHVFVSNGYFSKQLLELVLRERLLQAIRIDLKFIDNDKYKEITSGSLKPVLSNIKSVWEAGLHTEVINLVIPGLNDSEHELQELVLAVKRISPQIPLHFSAFHPDYKLSNLERTSIDTLLKAKCIAEAEGIEYVYVGNVAQKGLEDTLCPNCKKLLIERNGFSVLKNVFKGLSEEEKLNPSCPYCGYGIKIVL